MESVIKFSYKLYYKDTVELCSFALRTQVDTAVSSCSARYRGTPDYFSSRLNDRQKSGNRLAIGEEKGNDLPPG